MNITERRIFKFSTCADSPIWPFGIRLKKSKAPHLFIQLLWELSECEWRSGIRCSLQCPSPSFGRRWGENRALTILTPPPHLLSNSPPPKSPPRPTTSHPPCFSSVCNLQSAPPLLFPFDAGDDRDVIKPRKCFWSHIYLYSALIKRIHYKTGWWRTTYSDNMVVQA